MALDPLPDDLTSHKVVQLKVNLSLVSLFSSNFPHRQLTPVSLTLSGATQGALITSIRN